MAGRSVTFELPEDLYERLERRAAEAQRSLHDEIVYRLAEALAAEDGGLPPELEQKLAQTETPDDASL